MDSLVFNFLKEIENLLDIYLHFLENNIVIDKALVFLHI